MFCAEVMTYFVINLVLLLHIADVTDAGQKATLKELLEKHQTAGGCICISSKFGCHNIKSHKRLVQAGMCDRRCCTDRSAGGNFECTCVHGKKCPDDKPIEEGECPDLVHCCPKKPKREL